MEGSSAPRGVPRAFFLFYKMSSNYMFEMSLTFLWTIQNKLGALWGAAGPFSGIINLPVWNNINPRNTMKDLLKNKKTKNRLILFALLEPYWSLLPFFYQVLTHRWSTIRQFLMIGGRFWRNSGNPENKKRLFSK